MDRRAGKHETRPARHPPMLGIRPRAAKAAVALRRHASGLPLRVAHAD
jgi:hypothetical protein